MSTIAPRLDDWPTRLDAFIERRRRMPFKWGAHDCCQFARAAVAELRGSDPAAGLVLKRYKSCSGAALLLRKIGGIEALPGACGLEEIRVTMAGRGDVVVADFNARPVLGVCMGGQSAFPAKHGLVFLSTLACRRVWKV